MNDKELLTLAAKAAGIEIYFSEDGSCYHKEMQGNSSFRYRAPWNPLADDGDALRLAVKLRIWLDYRGCGSLQPSHISAQYQQDQRRSSVKWVNEHYVPEEMFSSAVASDRSHAVYQLETNGLTRGIALATRRAIVRAAAEIGKAMP